MSKKPQQKKTTTLRKHVPYAAVLVAGASFAGIGFMVSPSLFQESYVAENNVQSATQEREVESEEKVVIPAEQPIYLETPEQVKNIYMTACVVGTPSFREDLVRIAETTEINSIIIDIKDFSGGIAFTTDNPILSPYVSDRCGARDMRAFIKMLNEKGIYVIGRITVFQDPLYAVNHPEIAVQKESDRSIWADHKGIHFIDAGAESYWEYILELSLESYALGFDELNFDYIRFPSDGPMRDIYYPVSEERVTANPTTGKAEVVRDFFRFLHEELRVQRNIPISADLFGMTATNTDDLNIGQILEYALPYFDYVVPMVYPSHYPEGFNGWANPNDHVYDIVYFSMKRAFERAEEMSVATSTPADIRSRVGGYQLRTWIQDFDYGGDYGPVEVRAQIQASYDAGVNSWMVWAPSNRYTIPAFEKE